MEDNNKTVKKANEDYLSGEKLDVFFSNSIDVRASITDIMINFKRAVPEGYIDNNKIIMSPNLAKELKEVLEQAIYDYENVHGEVKNIEDLTIEKRDSYESSDKE